MHRALPIGSQSAVRTSLPAPGLLEEAQMGPLSRRAFLQMTGLGAAASAAACSLAAPPAVSPASADTAPAVPPRGPPTQDGTWERQWEDLIAAARAEGKLSLVTMVGSGYRTVFESFQQAFPGIAIDWLAESTARVWLDRVRQERQAGTYSFDLG